MKCFLVSMLVVVLVGGTFAEKPQMTQAEADVIVEREMFKFIHHDDWMDAIKYWKERGITDEMFAESYAKIARRTMNAPEGTKEHRMCSWAVGDGLRHHANEQQLSNLIYIAECASNTLVRQTAIHAFYTRTTKTHQYLDFVERQLKRKDLNYGICSTLFVGLSLDYDALPKGSTKLRERIAMIALDQVLKKGTAMVAGDILLTRCYPNYVHSSFHKQAVEAILDTRKSPLLGLRGEKNRSDMFEKYRAERKRIGK